jgi:hypothetical protein
MPEFNWIIYLSYRQNNPTAGFLSDLPEFLNIPSQKEMHQSG